MESVWEKAGVTPERTSSSASSKRGKEYGFNIRIFSGDKGRFFGPAEFLKFAKSGKSAYQESFPNL
jgi:hypothetical protein